MGKLGLKINKNTFKAGLTKLKEGGSFDNVQLPGGRYIVVFTKARAIDVKGKPKVVFDFTVGKDHEEYAGKSGSIFYSLEEEYSVHLFRALAALGFDIEDLDEEKLASILEEIETNRPVARIKAKENDDFTNYNIDRLVDGMTADEVLPDGVTAPAEGDSEPAAEAEEEIATDEDELSGLTRDELKKLLVKEKVEFKVFKNTEDDAIREAIRLARAPAEAAEEEPAPEEEAPAEEDQVELKVGAKVVVTVRGKEYKNCVVKALDEKTGKIKVAMPDKTVQVVTAEQITA